VGIKLENSQITWSCQFWTLLFFQPICQKNKGRWCLNGGLRPGPLTGHCGALIEPPNSHRKSAESAELKYVYVHKVAQMGKKVERAAGKSPRVRDYVNGPRGDLLSVGAGPNVSRQRNESRKNMSTSNRETKNRPKHGGVEGRTQSKQYAGWRVIKWAPKDVEKAQLSSPKEHRKCRNKILKSR
jgi:hypothetical protein